MTERWFEVDDGTGGGPRRLPAGTRESLRDALVRTRIPHRSVCGGSAICGTCWVDVVTEGLPAPAPDEQDLLDRFAGPAAQPRLACRLVTTEATPVVRVRLPRPS